MPDVGLWFTIVIYGIACALGGYRFAWYDAYDKGRRDEVARRNQAVVPQRPHER